MNMSITDVFFSYIPLSLPLLFFTIFFLSYIKNKKNPTPPSGPLSLPVVGHLYLYKKPLHHALSKISAKYGPALLLKFGSRRVFVVSSAVLAEECFSKNDITFANRPHLPSFKYLSYGYSTLSTAKYSAEWRSMRRIATVESLSTHRLLSFSSARADEVCGLVSGLFKDAHVMDDDRFKEVELRPRLFGMALNIMMVMLAGRRCYGEDSDEARKFEQVVEESFSIGGASNIGDFLPILSVVDLQGFKKKATGLQAWRDKFLQKLIDEQRITSTALGNGENKGRKTMIQVLLDLQSDDPESYSDRYIKALVVSLLSAGTDTSSNTVEWAMSLLLNHPEYLEKVREEIDAKLERGRLMAESDIPNLPFLHCIIQETLRLYPAGPLLVPHQSSEDCTVGGYRIPRDTMLLVNSYVIHRDPSIWEEPAKFKPERFQDFDGSKFFIPFGMGRRRCPGEVLAMREVSFTLAVLIQCFEWRRIGNELVGMDEGTGLTMPRAKPLVALYRPRPEMLDVLTKL